MLRIRASWIVALLLMCGRASAQDLTGDWQGTLDTGPRQLRVILHIEKGVESAWKATLASIDQSPDWGAAIPVDSLSLLGSSVKFTIAALRGTYDGAIAPDGNSIVGTNYSRSARESLFRRS